MESNSENNLQPESDHSGKHSSGRSHRSHHKHSSSRHSKSAKPYQYSKRPRLEDRPKREQQKKIESFLTKNILTVFGIIFIVGAIWFGIDNWKSIGNPMGLSLEKSKNVELTVKSKVDFLTSSVFTPSPLQTTKAAPDTSFILFLILPLVFILASLGLSIRRKNVLLKLLSFLAWISIAGWLLIKFFISSDSILFFGIIGLSTIFFGLFFVSGFVDTYFERRKWKYRLEYFLILLNSLFYFLTIVTILHKSGHQYYESVFVFLLSVLHLVAFYYTDKKDLTYNKVPYLLSALIITCSFLPLIFMMNPVIIFLSPLSVFLIMFSRYSRNQTSVLFSILAMMVMAISYVYQWVFEFIPEILLQDGILDNELFFKGLVSSIFILLALAINNVYLKKLGVSFTQKWLRKLNYLKFLKGLLLFVIYLSGYWVFNYIIQVIFKNERINLLTWFSFNCLYFLFYIPHLARQRSSYFRMIIIIAIVSSLACFTIIHFNVLQLRNFYLETKGATIFPFLFHYVPLALLIGMFFTLLHYFKRAFSGKKTLIKIFWIFLYLMGTFLLLSEFDHLAVLYGYHNGVMIDTTIIWTKRLPYSLLLILSSIIVITVGFTLKSRFLRIFSLFILGSVLIKILVYDVGSLGPQAKMILFLIMGVVLLGISISYPKIKRSFFQKDSPQSNGNYSGIRKHRSQINRKLSL
jgi:hypothetical protein